MEIIVYITAAIGGTGFLALLGVAASINKKNEKKVLIETYFKDILGFVEFDEYLCAYKSKYYKNIGIDANGINSGEIFYIFEDGGEKISLGEFKLNFESFRECVRTIRKKSPACKDVIDELYESVEKTNFKYNHGSVSGILKQAKDIKLYRAIESQLNEKRELNLPRDISDNIEMNNEDEFWEKYEELIELNKKKR